MIVLDVSKVTFIAAYRKELEARYGWAHDLNRIQTFLHSVSNTLKGDGDNTWNFHGEAVTAAWKRIGGKGVPSLKSLRALKGPCA